jgi:hypothetical protein
MSTMSAAEARLDADIRPEITVLRSRSSYPNRHRQADPPSRKADPLSRQADLASRAAGRARAGVGLSQLVASAVDPAPTRPAAAPSGLPPARVRPVGPESAPGPIRLTRRGRVVVAAASILAALAVACLAWLVVASQAQASSQVSHQRGSRDMTRVVVQPGATLWSIAVRADPGADPRAVIQQIMDANALSSPAIQAGQVLWVPRG